MKELIALSFVLYQPEVQEKIIKMLDYDEKLQILESMVQFLKMPYLYEQVMSKDDGHSSQWIDAPILSISRDVGTRLNYENDEIYSCLSSSFVKQIRQKQDEHASYFPVISNNNAEEYSTYPNVQDSYFVTSDKRTKNSENFIAPSKSFLKITPTIEQQKAIEMSVDGVIVNSFAGAGKTTTSGHIIEHLGSNQTLYTSFLRENIKDAESKLTLNAFTQDALSIRYALPISPFCKSFEASKAKKFTSLENLRMALGFPTKLNDGNKDIKSPMISRLIQQTLETYCQSKDQTISAKHVPFTIRTDDARNVICSFTEKYWNFLLSRTSHDGHIIKFSHIMKFWSLTPEIQIDGKMKNIVIDEAQDINAAFYSVLNNHADRNIVAIGDTYQELFKWRGAVNSMALFNLEVSNITKSFRFGFEIAEAANNLLNMHSSPPSSLIVPSEINSKVIFYESQEDISGNINTILTRTRAHIIPSAMLEMRENRKISVKTEFGILKWICADIIKLSNNKLDEITHEYISRCYSISNLQIELENTYDPEVSQALKLYDLYGKEVLSIISQVEEVNQLESQVTRLISTTHGVKGREWDHVLIAKDFEHMFNQKNVNLDDEICTLYVAITRARKSVYVPTCLKHLFQ